jgi:ribosome maturation factor RimP
MEDCERVSHHLSRVLLVENIDYDRLEVSSPGLDRVLKKEADFVRFVGQKAQVKVRMPVNGRKNFVGLLGAVQSGVLQMEIEGGSVSIELTNLDKARLVPVF